MEFKTNLVGLRTRQLEVVCNSTNKTGDNSYSVTLGNLSIGGILTASLKSCTFRNVFYNVSEGYNIFYINIQATQFPVTIPVGQYSVIELLPVLQAAIQEVFNTSGLVPIPTLDTLTYDSITAKITMAVNGNGGAPLIFLQPEQVSLNVLLGNTKDTDYFEVVAVDPIVFDSIISLGGIDSVNLVCPQLGQSRGIVNNEFKEGNGRTFGLVRHIPVVKSFGQQVEYLESDIDAAAVDFTSPVDITQLDISLQTTSGQILDLSNSQLTCEWILKIVS